MQINHKIKFEVLLLFLKSKQVNFFIINLIIEKKYYPMDV